MPTPKLSDEMAFGAVRAVREYGTVTEAAKALGLSRSTMQDRYKAGVQRTAQVGVEAPYIVRGTSTYFDRDGNATAQWVKTSVDDSKRQEMFAAAAEAMAQSLPRVKAINPPSDTNKALCNLYILTDSHVGMLAWHKEGGADWDLSIAEQTLTGCFMRMVDQAPKAADALICQLGDWMHYDSLLPVTPGHGHVLDADGRFSKMIGVAVRILRRVIDYALTKHDRVHIVLAEGNHDEAGSVWLRVMFAALYENEPRVIVNDSELPYYVHRHGETMLAFHHGHKRKNDQLPILFASQFPGIWGATSKRYCHTGHRHHEETKEHSGMKVTQHPTLAARDAYAARGGWISERQASAITYHDRFGRVGEVVVTPEMMAA